MKTSEVKLDFYNNFMGKLSVTTQKVLGFSAEEVINNSSNLVLIRLYRNILLYILVEKGFSYTFLSERFDRSYSSIRETTLEGERIVITKDYGYDVYEQIKESLKNG